jgi:hypothetical protein
MQKLFPTAGVVLIAVLLCAQSVSPLPGPADVTLELGTEGAGHQFHLGELIPIKFSYRAQTPGKYFWVSQSSKLAGGRSLEISCSPSAERVGMPLSSVDAVSFDQMLNAPCGGVGGGFSGGCGDCDWEQPLTDTALSFGVVPLNTYIRFRTPGTYTCEASSAEVTEAPRDEKIRPALLVKSNRIVLTIINDPVWAHSASIANADAYERLCRADDVTEHRSLQCFDVARRIMYLDTLDSLATEVKWYDGKNHGWENGFWEAIQHSSQPEEPLRLMALRMQDPDFQVSTSVLEWLATSELRMEVPDAFQSRAPAAYHSQAVEKLRKYVRLLGSSLSTKDSTALAESVKTYRNFAEQKYCERQSLVSTNEVNQVLASLDIKAMNIPRTGAKF